MTVTFFGNRIVARDIEAVLEKTIRRLVELENANLFYVGNNGEFDAIVASVLGRISKELHNVNYCVVLAYMSTQKEEKTTEQNDKTIFPEEVAKSIPRFAISRRNDWMLKNSEIVVTYVKNKFGCAEKYRQKAIRQGKRVINIAEL